MYRVIPISPIQGIDRYKQYSRPSLSNPSRVPIEEDLFSSLLEKASRSLSSDDTLSNRKGGDASLSGKYRI